MPMSLELVVDLGVVDDFAEEIDVVALEDLGGGVGEVDGALDAVTKAEGLGQLDGEAVGGEVRLGVAQVFDDRAAVVAFDLFLHELHDLRGAEIHALFGAGPFPLGAEEPGRAAGNRLTSPKVTARVGERSSE